MIEFVQLWTSPFWHRMALDGTETRCQHACAFMSGKIRAVMVCRDDELPDDPCLCCLTPAERERLYEKHSI